MTRLLLPDHMQENDAGFFCPACGTVFDDVMACRICQPKEYAKHFESCPKCDGSATYDSCLCKGNGIIRKRPEQLSLFRAKDG